MLLINKIFLLSVPMLAIVLTVVLVKDERIHMWLVKLIGVCVSTIPILGILIAYAMQKKSPGFSKACFIQAMYCGFGYVLMHSVLPRYI